jgi:hypothetical protein
LTFSIAQLTAAKEASLQTYLHDGESRLAQRTFLYHADGGARGVLALMLPDGAAHVFVVGQANRDNARRAATQFAHDTRLRADAVHFAVARTMADAFARVNRVLVEREHKRRAALLPKKRRGNARRRRRRRRRRSTMVSPENGALTVVQSSLGVAVLREHMPALHLAPVMAVAASDQDARALAGTRALEAWELTAATLVHKRHALVAQQFEAQVKFARHTAMPLGNIAGDFLRLVSDVHLARVLRSRRVPAVVLGERPARPRRRRGRRVPVRRRAGESARLGAGLLRRRVRRARRDRHGGQHGARGAAHSAGDWRHWRADV